MILSYLRLIIVLSFLVAGIGFALERVRHDREQVSASDQLAMEVLYLPSGQALDLLSIGYRNALADLLWFNTINYFGKHYTSDRNYQWFGHMCKLVTDLDPRIRDVYEFCSTMLAWEANQPSAAIELLSKAIKSRPPDQYLYYLRGFTYLYFVKDPARARTDFVEAAKFPDASIITKRLAASTETLYGDPETALTLLTDMISKASDPNQRKALEDRLRESRYEIDLRALDLAVRRFREIAGRPATRIEELLERKIASSIPADPFGGTYYIDPQSGAVKSTSNKRRLQLFEPKG